MLARLLSLLIEFLNDDLRPCIREIREYLREKQNERVRTEAESPDPLYDAKYAEDRIGVGEKTIYRLTKKGALPIARYLNRRRHFRESDIERCRRMYGRE